MRSQAYIYHSGVKCLCFRVGWGIALLMLSLFFVGCGKPGNSANNYTNSIVTITSLNDNQPFQSDVLTDGYATDDVITAKLQCDFRAADDDPTAPDGPSVFDTIIFHSYHVGHQRSDGGANPSDFTAGLTLSVAPDSEAEVNVVIVRAFDKNRSPLEELRDDGEIFTTTTLTLYGQDGYGNDIAVSASLAISFANFPDE
ncbi:hypothetical protein U27_04655 [Candidatus Vecturithrix granuli]|uniref:Lipoprotein n=1 Tax=Vecturithrix granuli TaxID=1499967 RepID=A0A081BZD3_VECG1|nr:hypothetical protein U27_04655 [Candidatus Vecturithrix granuli]